MTKLPFALLILVLILTFGCDSNPASFEDSIPVYSLTTHVSPDEGGTINPSGGEFTSGDNIVIEARAADGYIFDRWENDLTGNQNPETLGFQSNKTVTAHFSKRDYNLNIEISGEGIVRETVAERSSEEGADSLGTSIKAVRLTAEAEDGWYFDRWEGDLRGSDNPEIISVEEDKSVTAIFDREIEDGYTITINIEGEGSVTKDPDRTYFAEGDEVILTANPESGWNFIEWRGDLSGRENSQTIVIEGDIETTAIFGEFEEPFLEIIKQPSTTMAGSPLSPAPEVKFSDEVGDPIEGAEINVTLNRDSFISGSSTSIVTNAEGIAIFDNLIIEAAASGYILTFESDEDDVSDISSTPFQIVAANADPSSSSAEVPSEGSVGESIEITIHLEDSFGNNVSGAADDLSVQVSGANSASPSVSDGGDGEYTAGYSPTHSGSDQITITVNGEEISGSPFSTDIAAGSPSELNITQQPSTVRAGSKISPAPAVRILDDFGNALEDIEVTAELDGAGFASGSTTSAETNSNGVATFDNLVIHNAGSEYSLTFEGNGFNKTSDKFDVEPASADPSSSSAEVPSEGSVGESIEITINLEDSFGNNISGAADDLSVQVSGANSTSPSVSEAGDGEYTAGYSPTHSGSDQITITVNGEEISGSPFSTDIAAGSPSEMTITQQPSVVRAGSSISPAPAVRILDGFGNALADIDVTAELEGNSFASGSTTSAQTNSNGVASFDNLVINTAGSGFTLTFEVNGLSKTSESFAVEPASADPSSSSAEVPDGETGRETVITITVEDRFGNSVSGAENNISVNISGSNSSSPSVSETNTSGEYTARYTPESAGNDQIDIQINGISIGDSPYSSSVTAAEASSFNSTVTTDPEKLKSGESSTVTIVVRDNSGNIIGGLNNSDFNIRLVGEATAGSVSETSIAGTYEFEVTSNEMGDVTVIVTVNGITLNDTPVITFEAGDPNEIEIIVQPEDTFSGQPIKGPPTVRVTDEFGQTVPDINVRVREQGGQEFSSGDLVVTTDESGIAEFSNLVIHSRVGWFNLVFSVDGVDDVISDRFRVSVLDRSSTDD